MTEQALVGGMDSGRGVVRAGDTVRRPGMRPPVRALLRHLEAAGRLAGMRPALVASIARGGEV